MSDVNGASKLPIRPTAAEMPVAWLLHKTTRNQSINQSINQSVNQ